MDSWDNPAYEAALAYQKTAALIAAIKLDIVTLIGSGAHFNSTEAPAQTVKEAITPRPWSPARSHNARTRDVEDYTRIPGLIVLGVASIGFVSLG